MSEKYCYYKYTNTYIYVYKILFNKCYFICKMFIDTYYNFNIQNIHAYNTLNKIVK